MGIRLQRFDLKSVCGRGGMAEVWRAVHVDQGIPVAVKVMTAADARSPRFRDALHNEVRAAARLHHPSIVTVLELGVVDEAAAAQSGGRLVAGSPFLAMEYASGGTLERVRGPLEFGAIREILLALLDALAHAHARGVLHRDIKPQNVLLAGPGDLRPGLKLTDFGIAHPLEEERVADADDESSGTPQFMAPEQFYAQWRDYGPWTDLYAVGCIAFCLASGTLPFDGDNFARLAVQHVRTPVPDLLPGHAMPSGFEAWVRRLLEKSPRERFQCAADASWALRELVAPAPSEEVETLIELGRSEIIEVARTVATQVSDVGQTIPWAAKTLTTDAWRELQQQAQKRRSPSTPKAVHRIPPMPPSWRREEGERPPPRLLGAGLGLYALRSVPLVDRDAERDVIWNAIANARASGRANAVLLLGSAGNGKSRIAEWVSQRAHEVGAAIPMRAVHGPNASLRDGIAGMLARYLRCTGLDREKTEDRVATILGTLGETSVDEARALAALLHPDLASHAASPSDGPAVRLETATERHVVARRLLVRIATERPMILWLDDAQWGSDALAFALHVLRAQAEAPCPVTILLTAREDLLAERPVEADLVAELQAMPESTTVEVAPLEEADHRALVAELLGLQGDLVEQVAARTDGNPLFAVQLVGDWVQRGLLELTEAGFTLSDGVEAKLPDDLHAVWSQRIDALLLGRAAEERIALELAAVLGIEVNDREWACVSRIRGVVRPQAVISELLTRRLVHRTETGFAFAHVMLRESLQRTAEEARRLADHNRACAMGLEELYGTEWPEMAERVGRHLLAAGRFEEALAPLIRRVRGWIVTGEYAAAAALLEVHAGALEQANVPGADSRWGEHWVLRARASTRRGDFELAGELATRAEAAATRHDWHDVLAEAVWERGSIAYEQNAQSDAIARFEEARDLFSKVGDQGGVARSLRGIGDSLYRLGDLDGAEARYQEALEVFVRIKEITGSLACAWGLGYVQLWKGDLAAARETFGRQLEMAESGGHRHDMARALSGLGEVARIGARFDEAENHYRRAISLFEAVGSPEADMGAMNLGLTLVGRGDLEQAFAHGQALRGKIERSGDRLKACYVFLLVLPYLTRHEVWSEWDAQLDALEHGLSQLGLHDGDVAAILQLVGDIARERGDQGRARRAYDLALNQWRGLMREDKVVEIERLRREA